MTSTDDTDTPSPGWDAISARLAQLYPGQEPKHFGTLISHMLGGLAAAGPRSVLDAPAPSRGAAQAQSQPHALPHCHR